MTETFVATVARSLTIVKGKDDGEDWEDERYDDIVTCIENTGNSVDLIIDREDNGDEDKIKFYFLTCETEKIGSIETDRKIPMQPGDYFIGSSVFDDMVASSGYANLFTSGEMLKIVSVIHDDRINSIVYELRKYIKSNRKEFNQVINLDDYEFFDGDDGEYGVRKKKSKEDGNLVHFPSMYFPDNRDDWD